MKITLYSFGKKEHDLSRVSRVRWALAELGLEYAEVDVVGSGLFGTDEWRAISPLGALPALELDGKTYVESAAICTILADRFPERGLIAAPPSPERAEHEQWVSFALTGMEAWMWHSAKHTFRYPEERRIGAVVEPNSDEFRDGAAALERVMAGREYLVGNRFSVTDIVVGYTLNWARLVKLLGPFPELTRYVERLLERPACALPKRRG